MSAVNVNETITPSQLGIILNDIALSAKAIRRFSIFLGDEENDERDADAAITAIQSIAERIGFLADRAADATPGTLGAVCGSTAESWMMPPAYYWKEEDQGQPISA